MPLLKHGALVSEDEWTFVEDEADLPAAGCVTVGLERFKAEQDAILARNTRVGVRLTPDDDPHDLADALDRIGLIEVTFPKYTDGRGYSQAQLLRRRLGYRAELRAVGDVLRDQLQFMVRSGFDAVDTKAAGPGDYAAAQAEFSQFYQRAADGVRPAFAARHERAS
ncbi:MAG: DUF934 domain-containing protein [Pseudomonadota bacterium]